MISAGPRLKPQFDSGAKIVSGLPRVLEYRLGVADENESGIIDWLLIDAVSLLLLNLECFRLKEDYHYIVLLFCVSVEQISFPLTSSVTNENSAS